MRKTPTHHLAIWSIAAFLIPLGIAWHFRIVEMIVVLSIVIALSFANHITQNPIAETLDTIFAWILMASHLALCYLGDFSAPYFFVVLALIPIALYFYYQKTVRRYDLSHGLWHVCSALISVFSLLTFVSHH